MTLVSDSGFGVVEFRDLGFRVRALGFGAEGLQSSVKFSVLGLQGCKV